ncbi:MAG: hypothetical protein ACE5J2_08365 [Nitrososphaerales archaeon]
MGKRGPLSYAERLLASKEFKDIFSDRYEFELVSNQQLGGMLKIVNRREWFWTLVYDIPERSKKGFYRNLAQLKKHIACQALTKSTLRVESIWAAAMISFIVKKWKGTCYVIFSSAPVYPATFFVSESQREGQKLQIRSQGRSRIVADNVTSVERVFRLVKPLK